MAPYSNKSDLIAYQKAWISSRRAEFFADKACVQCGSTTRLELDHVDPALKISHKIWSWSADRRATEIAKCQVLCGDHHHLKSYGWLPADGRPHGRQKYEIEGCRCPDCVEGARRHWRESKARNVAKRGR